MRKTFLFACAAIAATLSFTSCTNEVLLQRMRMFKASNRLTFNV